MSPGAEREHAPGAELLAPDGGLARAIPHYEDRAEQRAMAVAVARSLADERTLIVEAGTGTGKTLAYLIPALMSGKRVVVSTGTRALQDQIARHDVPLLREILPKPFSVVVLKGVQNYVCKRRLAELTSRASSARDAAVSALASWADETETGDRAEVEWLGEDAPLWAEVTTTPEARIGPRCPYFERCFATRARRAAESAQLVLVNHHLYLADRALRASSPGARVLPDHEAVIFDEAHQLEDVATEHFSVRVSTQRLGMLVRDAHAGLSRMALWTGRSADDAIAAVERAGVALFAHVRAALVTAANGDAIERVPLPVGLFDHAERQAAWFRFDTALEELARVAEAESSEPPDAATDRDEPDPDATARASLVGLARRARELREDLAAIAEQRNGGHVYWGNARGAMTTIAVSPIAVAQLMRRYVLDAGPTAIFTSATLATENDFAYARTRLGLADADELLVPSPFDYASQAILYVPRDLPEPRAAYGYPAEAAQRTRELLALTGGRAFLLFTSHRAMQAAAAQLADLPYPRLVQGDAPRGALIEKFRAQPGAVLFGTSSFWEGVDVPGDALSLVVIDKLPFAPHTDPLIAARMTACEAAGGDPFAQIQLPAAAIALKQGFGRLIRRRDDRGIVAVLDPRIVTRGYGRTFLATLPTGLPRTSALDQVRRWWQRQPYQLSAIRSTR